MEPFAFTLVEASRAVTFTRDHQRHRQYTVRSRSGLLERRYDNGWQNRFLETSSLADLPAGLDRKLKVESLEPGESLPDSGELLEGHRPLFEWLKQAGLAEWQVAFRARLNRKWILNAANQPLSARFRHFSATVRFRLWPGAGYLEIGEGNTSSPRFNCSGLIQRLAEMQLHHRQRRRLELGEGLALIMHAGEGAIFFHELLGHALEADHVWQRQSPFTVGDLGRVILPPDVTVLTDDGRDTFFADTPCDDEGERAAPLLVEQGILRGLIADRFFGQLLQLPGAGHARLEDFSRPPLPRMFALYIPSGPVPAAEIVRSTRRGILAREFGSGRVDLQHRTFAFDICQAELVEEGRPTAPLGRVSVQGDIRQVLQGICQVGDDFKYDRGISYCRKQGQVLQVRVGQPTIRVEPVRVKQVDG